MNGETLKTTRAVHVTRIPSGEQIELPADTPVVVTQALGGSYTLLVPSQAGLYRLAGTDVEAIGQPIVAGAAAPEAVGGQVGEGAVWDVLKTCYDPEIPVDIVNLGLIYGCDIQPGDSGSQVNVKMTLTAPGCGMGPVLAAEAEEKIRALPGVSAASVEVVWEPPWSPDRISAEGREKLGMV
jgi:probable FeS assembly SUF system protein SufT